MSAGNRRKLLQFSTIEHWRRQLQSDRQNSFLRRMAKNVFEDGEDQLTDTVFPSILIPAILARVPVALVLLNFCDAFAKSQPRSGRHGLRHFGSVRRPDSLRRLIQVLSGL